MNFARQVQRAFTLVEVMVVIVIMTIITSLVVLNIDSITQRRAMQARDSFLLDLQRIGRESVDQSMILALSTQNATDVAPFRYAVLRYTPAPTNVENGANLNTPIRRAANSQSLWQPYAEFKLRELPSEAYLRIEASEDNNDALGAQRANNHSNRGNGSPLLDAQAPQLIWLGNGEVKPVRIQFYVAQRPIGAAISIDHLGKISDAQ